MRSPAPAFDLRAALAREITEALSQLSNPTMTPKSVHRCRVYIKRARALARIGRVCAPGLATVFNESARATMRALAHAREGEALAEAAEAAGKKTNKRGAAALAVLAQSLARVYLNIDTPDIQGARVSLKDLLALAQVWPEVSPRQVRRGAEQIARRARRARRRSLHCHDPELLHDWRKREKDRLYAVELLGDSWPYRRSRKLSEKLTATLGEVRDMRLLHDRVEAAVLTCGSAKADRRALHALEQRLEQLHKCADRLGEKLRRKRA
ncbi:MAG: CHAD domain-containing protein [Terricaulis sp.]